MNENLQKDFPPLDFSKPSDLVQVPNSGTFCTVENWEEQYQSFFAPMEYIQGSEHVINIVDHILGLELDFDELKKQLTGFIAERLVFINSAKAKYDNE